MGLEWGFHWSYWGRNQLVGEELAIKGNTCIGDTFYLQRRSITGRIQKQTSRQAERYNNRLCGLIAFRR